MKKLRIWLLLGMFPATLAFGAGAGNCWHIPSITQDGIPGKMRDGYPEAAVTNTYMIYQGVYKGGGDNQTGGTLYYRYRARGAAGGAWSSAALGWYSNYGNNQFWTNSLPMPANDADIVEYYLKVTYDGSSGSNPETTFLYGGDLDGHNLKTTSEATAQAAPCSVRNRPGWIFHANNRVTEGADVVFWTKTGYIGKVGDLATRWANAGAVYYTTDGSAPGGSLGTPTGTSMAVALAVDHLENDPSGSGNAVWWKGRAAGLGGVALGTVVKYKVGFWHADNQEEKFAEHVAGADNTVFVYTNGVLGDPVLTVNGLNANYTTTKVFVDEIAGDSVPLNIVFQPGQAHITDVEIFTNLNRRDRAGTDADGDGYPDGISGPSGAAIAAGDDTQYYKAYDMTNAGSGAYTLTLAAQKTGAYRLTARWKVEGDDAWRWYTNGPANRRDHAITVSPKSARDIVLYEINVLNIEATDDTFQNRSTIEDMHNASGAWHNGNNRWDLDYLLSLGANWLWFQPIHPPARDGREPFGGWGSGNPPYEPGSPYAVKNFFEVSAILSRQFSGDPYSNTDLQSAANRAAAMGAWSNFVGAADAKGVGIMLDAPFNHTAFDVELAQAGVDLLQPDGQGWSKTDEIRNREARVFSRSGNYANRASVAANIAAAPDRYDFGKWPDVFDVFFGRYDALVEGDYDPERGSYTSEGDWFDPADTDWTDDDFVQGGQNRNVTRRLWQYFAAYAPYWLAQTRPAGRNRNSTPADGDAAARRAWDDRGIDGIRCDFGQGLPPQAWEYIINVARSYKWNFVMMSESLDGGAVTYRSNRHFDILNENIVFPLKTAVTKWDYRNIYEDRRRAYGQGLVLSNTTSHDEQNFSDPWQAVVRFSVGATLDGAPMIFPGQELGISTTYGYLHYELNFGKQVPHFKRFNSMQPIWNDANWGNDQLFPVFAGLTAARNFSPALRASNRWFLDGDGNNSKIHAVAKYETANASPAFSDVVLAFANLDRDNDQQDNFKLPGALAPLLGVQDGRTYNVKNIAAYLNPAIGMAGRRDAWLWGAGYTGAQLKSAGFLVALKKVPTTGTGVGDPGGWATAPFEGQFLKLYDVTPPPQAGTPGAPKAYAIGDTATFTWTAGALTADDNIAGYVLTVGTTPGGADVFAGSVGANLSYAVTGAAGQTLYATVHSVSAAGMAGAESATSAAVRLLAPGGDADGDGVTNQDEDRASTDPLDPASWFHIVAGPLPSGFPVGIVVTTAPGRTYTVEFNDHAGLAASGWATFGNAANGVWTETGGTPATHTFTDDATVNTTTNIPPAGARRAYRVKVQ